MLGAACCSSVAGFAGLAAPHTQGHPTAPAGSHHVARPAFHRAFQGRQLLKLGVVQSFQPERPTQGCVTRTHQGTGYIPAVHRHPTASKRVLERELDDTGPIGHAHHIRMGTGERGHARRHHANHRCNTAPLLTSVGNVEGGEWRHVIPLHAKPVGVGPKDPVRSAHMLIHALLNAPRSLSLSQNLSNRQQRHSLPDLASPTCE